jgi:hypothetical protein
MARRLPFTEMITDPGTSSMRLVFHGWVIAEISRRKK